MSEDQIAEVSKSLVVKPRARKTAKPAAKISAKPASEPASISQTKPSSKPRPKQSEEEKTRRAEEARKKKEDELKGLVAALMAEELDAFRAEMTQMRESYESEIGTLEDQVRNLVETASNVVTVNPQVWLFDSTEALLEDVMAVGGFPGYTSGELKKEGVRYRIARENPSAKPYLELVSYITRNGRFAEKLMKYIKIHAL